MPTVPSKSRKQVEPPPRALKPAASKPADSREKAAGVAASKVATKASQSTTVPAKKVASKNLQPQGFLLGIAGPMSAEEAVRIATRAGILTKAGKLHMRYR